MAYPPARWALQGSHRRLSARLTAVREVWNDARTRRLVLLGGIAAVICVVYGFVWLGLESYGGGLLVEATSLIISTFVLAFFLDSRAKKREEEREARLWGSVRELNKRRLARELDATHRSFDAFVGLELHGRRVSFFESQETLPQRFAKLRSAVRDSKRRDEINLTGSGSATPGQRMSDTSRHYIDRVVQVGLATPTPDRDAQLVELVLRVDEANHAWEDEARWIGTDLSSDAADALEALLEALERLSAALA